MMDQTRSQQMDDYMKAHLKRSRRRKRILVVVAALLIAAAWHWRTDWLYLFLPSDSPPLWNGEVVAAMAEIYWNHPVQKLRFGGRGGRINAYCTMKEGASEQEMLADYHHLAEIVSSDRFLYGVYRSRIDTYDKKVRYGVRDEETELSIYLYPSDGYAVIDQCLSVCYHNAGGWVSIEKDGTFAPLAEIEEG